ncbi:GDSL-type esterase/lipase family protein [Litchfieldia salsa]|nr:GDSL-type esterase/lipase family protein [Litchfieldia salsa]
MVRIFIIFTVLLLTACSTQTSNNNFSRNVYHNVLLLKKDNVPSSFFPKEMEILSIGDSLTEGVGDITNNGGYTSFLKRHIQGRNDISSVEIFNFGVEGHTSNDLLQRIKNDIPTEVIVNSDTIIITIGGNDIMQVVQNNFMNLTYEPFNVERNNYEQRLKQIIEKIKSINEDSQIYVVGLYNPFIHIGDIFGDIERVITEWNKVTQEVLLQYDDTTFVEIEDIFKNSNEILLYSDDFHPNTRGYELISQRIHEYLDQAN